MGGMIEGFVMDAGGSGGGRCRRGRLDAHGAGWRTCVSACSLSLLMGAVSWAADAPPEVKVVRPSRGPISRFVALPASARADSEATLYAKVAGYLKTISVDRGDRVTSGQLLAEIEAPELAADAARFRAEMKVAEIDSRRVGAAMKKAPDLVEPRTADEAQGRAEVAKAQLDRTETLLGYTRITAPFSGVVTARFVDPGAFIPAATSGTAGRNAAILTVADFSKIRVVVPVPELEAAQVRVGQVAKAAFEALKGSEFQGTVSRMAYALDEITRTMTVEIDLPNPDLTLRPGMYAIARIAVEEHADALRLPSTALQIEKAGSFIFLAADGKLKRVAVKVGLNDGAMAEILGGLEGNEAVVATVLPTMSDGGAVRTVEKAWP